MRISLCNEVIGELPFERQCAMAAALGYDGLEIAPVTLTDDPTTLGSARIAEVRRAASGGGIRVTGVECLLCEPGGRIGGAGPPDQARPEPGDAEEGRGRGIDCFAGVADAAHSAGVTYCIEPLARNQTAFVNTVQEAADIVRAINNPALRTMIDCSAAGQAESEPVDALVRRWLPSGLIAHVHFNDPNRRGPGEGGLAFGPILSALRDGGYQGNAAIEPFVYQPDGPTCAARGIGYIRGIMETL